MGRQSIQGIKVTDLTNVQQIVVQTSPHDPTTITLDAGGSATIHPTCSERHFPTCDVGPYTVSFKPASKVGVVPKDSKTATVALETVTVGQGPGSTVVTSAVVSSTSAVAGSEFTVED